MRLLFLFRKRIIRHLLRIFSIPRVREEFARIARGFTGEAGRYASGIKGEAVETRDAFIILTRYMRREKITREEKRQFQMQVYDILKGIGIVVPPMLIPLPFVGTILLIIVDQLLLSLKIHILPSSFYPAQKKPLLTPESVEEELETKLKEDETEPAKR
jgi:hypothetical protein